MGLPTVALSIAWSPPLSAPSRRPNGAIAPPRGAELISAINILVRVWVLKEE